jgi:hypothetical protein
MPLAHRGTILTTPQRRQHPQPLAGGAGLGELKVEDDIIPIGYSRGHVHEQGARNSPVLGDASAPLDGRGFNGGDPRTVQEADVT